MGIYKKRDYENLLILRDLDKKPVVEILETISDEPLSDLIDITEAARKHGFQFLFSIFVAELRFRQ